MIKIAMKKIHSKTTKVINNVFFDYFTVEANGPKIIKFEPDYNNIIPQTLYVYKGRVETIYPGKSCFTPKVIEISGITDDLFSLECGTPTYSKWGLYKQSIIKELTKNAAKVDTWKYESKDIFSDFDDKSMILIYDDLDSHHAILNSSGEPVPLGIQFDYISGHVTNAYYDLKKVREILSKRKDISDLKTTSIPYYNVYEDIDSQVEFIWNPSSEDFKKVWAASNRKSYTSIRETTIEQDTFGFAKYDAIKQNNSNQ